VDVRVCEDSEHGADANVVNIEGKTPLHLLLENGHSDEDDVLSTARSLLEHGADVNIRTMVEWAPLHLDGSLGIARVLLEHSADVNAENEQSEGPLLLASQGNYKSQEHGLARLFLERRTDVNTQAKNGWTPLHAAVFSGRIKVVGMLLDQGANANAENDQGQTALHLVSGSNYIPQEHVVGIAELLLEHGADIIARDKDHATPLQLARSRGLLDIESVLLDYVPKERPRSGPGPIAHGARR
jgi:ankyrin repeat protein